MRRAARWLAWITAGLVGLPVLAVVLILLAANTDPGRHAIESIAPRLTGDTIRLGGLSGRFPDALHVAQLELRDPQGAYATVQDATLDWSPLQLLHWHLVINRLSAAQIAVTRMPAPSSSSSSSGLPLSVAIDQLNVARLDIGAALAGTPVSVAVTGSGEATSETDFHGKLDIHQRGGGGRYTVNASGNQTDIDVQLGVNEPAHGLLAGIAGLPDLGDIALDASLQGPRGAIATRMRLDAGPLHASVGGMIDLTHQTVDLMVSASAPAMHPRNDVAWRSVALDAHVHGPFSKPDAAGRLRVDALTAAGIAADTITADIAGNAGRLHLDGAVIGLRVPTPKPDLLSNEPLVIHADATLDVPDRPVHITLQHKLFNLEANGTIGNDRRLDATLNVSDVAPFAAMDGLDLNGGTSLTLHAAMQGDTTTVTADGTVAITGGMQQVRALVGEKGQLHLAAALHGSDLTLSQLQFTGQSVGFTANGTLLSNQADIDWTLHADDLAAADPALNGQLQATGKITGPTDDFALTSEITGGVGARGLSSGALTVDVTASGLPNNPRGNIGAQGTLLDSPINVTISMQRTADGFAIDIRQADWKSFQAQGALQIPTATMVPAGNLRVVMRRLADLEPLLGRPVAGSVDASLDASTDKATLTLKMDGAALPGTAATSRLVLDATVDQPVSHPTLNARLNADGIKAGGVAGSLRATANGPVDAIATKLVATLDQGNIDATATVDTVGRTISVASLQAEWRKQTIRLLAPVRVAFDNGVAFDRLRLGLRQAVLDVSGRVGSTLDITASLRNLPANIATIISPELAADGVVEADARVTGTPARPAGKLRFAAKGLRASSGPGRAVPPTDITATATLDGTAAQIDARVTAGRSHVNLTGRAPLSAAGSLGLRANGLIDLAVADPILSAGGRRVRGQVTLDLTITGPATSPAFAGTVRLTGGELQDYGTGVHLSDIAAQIEGNGNSLRISQLTAKAGPGTLTLSGTIGAMAPGIPVDLTLTAHNAVPLASDMVTATMDANLAIRGQLAGQLTVGGSVQVQRADIRVPERMPAAIAVLPVREAGSKPPPAQTPAATSTVALNLTIDAPQQIFVRGRGLDAEFAGKMQVTGTVAAPRTVGSLHMRRGTLSLAGRTLDFTSGDISFNGGSLTNPALDLVATSSSGSVTATLTIGGTVQAPKVTLTSVPALPQDEVLAHLLFGTGVGRLGALEVAEIATGLATLTGAGGGFGDPLDKVRQGLGLDRLSVGSNSSGSPTLEAGRYIAPGVYLGAQQRTSGGGTQATVQVDITKGLKLQATAGSGGTSATGADGASNGTSVGLTYQFQY